MAVADLLPSLVYKHWSIQGCGRTVWCCWGRLQPPPSPWPLLLSNYHQASIALVQCVYDVQQQRAVSYGSAAVQWVLCCSGTAWCGCIMQQCVNAAWSAPCDRSVHLRPPSLEAMLCVTRRSRLSVWRRGRCKGAITTAY